MPNESEAQSRARRAIESVAWGQNAAQRPPDHVALPGTWRSKARRPGRAGTRKRKGSDHNAPGREVDQAGLRLPRANDNRAEAWGGTSLPRIATDAAGAHRRSGHGVGRTKGGGPRRLRRMSPVHRLRCFRTLPSSRRPRSDRTLGSRTLYSSRACDRSRAKPQRHGMAGLTRRDTSAHRTCGPLSRVLAQHPHEDERADD